MWELSQMAFMANRKTKNCPIIYSWLMRQVNEWMSAFCVHRIKLTVPNFFTLELDKLKTYCFPLDKLSSRFNWAPSNFKAPGTGSARWRKFDSALRSESTTKMKLKLKYIHECYEFQLFYEPEFSFFLCALASIFHMCGSLWKRNPIWNILFWLQ